MFDFLKGYKTYAVSAVGVVVAGAMALGFIPFDIGAAILAALGFTSQVTMRAGVSEETKKAVAQLANPTTKA
jgi:hypothetical protein